MVDKVQKSFASKFGGKKEGEEKSTDFASKFKQAGIQNKFKDKPLSERFKRKKDDPEEDEQDESGNEESGDEESGGILATTKKIIKKSESEKEMSFAEKNKRKNSSLFLVRGKDRGYDAWHYVLVHKAKKEEFLRASRTGSIDVSLFGEIVKSGWGVNPSEEIKAEMEEKYG